MCTKSITLDETDLSMKARTLGAILLLATACQFGTRETMVQVRNPLSIARDEIIEIKLSDISSDTAGYHRLSLQDGEEEVSSQVIDSNGDGVADILIARVMIGPEETKELRVRKGGNLVPEPAESKVYSRFVPERTDDFAWENDLVAFRTYGPEAQRLVEEGEPGGTLSSGIDCWLKRVNYPVINKWYEKNLAGGSYHKDDGEGYDPYHVGKSRGCGGIGVWTGDSLFVSRNFTAWKIIAEGPLRNIFELEYAPWKVDDIIVRERKRVSIDVGSQLMRIDNFLESTAPLPHVTVGLTLHDGKGLTFTDSLNGVFGYWEKIDDAHLGTGLVIDPASILHFEDFRSPVPDQNHILVNVAAVKRVSYFAGFGWEKAGTITSPELWREYLNNFSRGVRAPLIVTVSE